MKRKIPGLLLILPVTFLPVLNSCFNETAKTENIAGNEFYIDVPFIQETHEAFMISDRKEDNEVRSIAVDRNSNVWIATASGIFLKKTGTKFWEPVINGDDRGPAYSVICNSNGDILFGTWNGIYRYSGNILTREEGVKPPISEICNDGNCNYALGPHGIWRYSEGKWKPQPNSIARSVRDAETDSLGNLWVATDAGLYCCSNGNSVLFQDTTEIISSYIRAISFSKNCELWAGGLGGVSIRKDNILARKLTPSEGIPSGWVNCIRCAGDGRMWVGTDAGIVRFNKDFSHSLRFSKRWLTDNKVNDIAFDNGGTAWIATGNGVSNIKIQAMTLAGKEGYYYNQLMRKHIRSPWVCGNLRLEFPGDTSSWSHSDDDNDGEYTGGYLAMESFRYAVTGSEDARLKARKAFDFLKLLQEVTGTDGFFARTIIPADWKSMNDGNRTYTERQLADLLVEDPRYKPVEIRWHLSKDKKWLWKGDTSSDEMDGHMMGYFFYYEYAAGEDEKKLIRAHVRKIMDQLILNNYNMIDVDGKHTRWAVWSPEQLNGDPDWASEKSLNSFELLAYLKFASHITGDDKYEREYRRLIDEEGYLKNASGLNSKNPAWQIYFDLTMEGYLFPILLKYEEEPELKKFYLELIDDWMNRQKAGENLINNLTFALATGKKVNVKQTIEFLKDAPLDLVDWTIDHTIREDVKTVRKPMLEEIQINELPPASERATVRWDKNPWAAVSGDPKQVREPNFWLWPYWMARYLDIIQKE
jgi:hypothetical protein